MKVFKRKIWRRNNLILGILLFFMIGNGVIFAEREKPGAILDVQKKDGQAIQGELLAINHGMLTLLIYENASKVDVQLGALVNLRIVRKGAFGKGLLIGALVGGGVGALLGLASGDDENKGLFDFFNFTAGQKALGLGAILGVVGGSIGGIAGALKGTDESIRLDGLRPEKLALVEAKLASLARYRTNPTSFWKFIFTGPSIETHMGTFDGAKDGGYFDFPGITGYSGTYRIDGDKIILKPTSHPAMQFSGQFTAKNTMAGSCTNNNETWSWAATRETTTAAVEQTPVMQSKLFSNLLPVPAAEPLIAPLPEAKPTPSPAGELPDQVSAATAPPAGRKISRWHVSFIPGFFYSQGADGTAKAIARAGFGGSRAYSEHWVWLFGLQPGGSVNYPTKDSSSHLVWKNIQVEYSLTPRLALGLVYTPLGEFGVTGWKYLERKVDFFNAWSDQGVYLSGRFRGKAYFITAAYMPLPDMFLRKSMLKIGAGVGLASIDAAFSEETQDFPAQVDKREFTRLFLSLTAFMQIDRFFGRHLSLGFNLDYKYVPFHADAFKLTVPYTFDSTHETVTVAADVPGFRMNMGGFGVGVSFGFHF